MVPDNGPPPIETDDADWLDRRAELIGRSAREIQRELNDLEVRIAMLDAFIRNLVRDERAATASDDDAK
ncbi:MAG TPA: hypothetical protein VMC10_22980 [Stellaceae bacterium]|nr:hypothetical protein [Stellaceae bacterium]